VSSWNQIERAAKYAIDRATKKRRRKKAKAAIEPKPVAKPKRKWRIAKRGPEQAPGNDWWNHLAP